MLHCQIIAILNERLTEREYIMLKFENTAEVGDVIKAFDFQPMEGREDSYLIGRVVAKGPIYGKPFPEMEREVYICDGYTVYVTDSVSGSDVYDIERMATEIFVPFEMSITDFDERVTVVACEGTRLSA